MTQRINSQIEGEFNGFNDGAIFRLVDGTVWQQKNYQYMYIYAYRPQVSIHQDNIGRWIMKVDIAGCPPIEVQQVRVIQEGHIISDFKGFFQDAKFEFQNGNIWEQAEYKYNYHYSYRPYAVIIDGIRGRELSVDGMSETVRVRLSNR